METNCPLLELEKPTIGTAEGSTFAYFALNIEDTSKMLTIM
jgi:hypothetical protein